MSSLAGGIGVLVVILTLALSTPWLWAFLVPFTCSVLYRLVWLPPLLLGRDFDLVRHRQLVRSWKPARLPSVDVFLPVCGEPYEVIANTWRYVARLSYGGRVSVYVLDDSASEALARLATEYDFTYLARPNRGWHKKAGNLRYGYERSDGDYIVVFDADFCPRPDFLTELLPHFDDDPSLGIVQSPQYFRPAAGQGWVERGASSIQIPFYKILQWSRQNHNGAICVGTNAIYRRRALDDNGGNAMVDYSEDVHTGIELRRLDWHLRYVPINLATGLSPDQLSSFFTQQYRWSRGSLGLRTSRKFWSIPMPVMSRLAYLSGPLNYLHRVIMTQLVPGFLVIAMIATPASFGWRLYVMLMPAAVLSAALYRQRRRSFHADGLAAQLLASWSAAFALSDLVRGRAMAWQPTGGRASGNKRFHLALRGVLWWNGGSGVTLVLVAVWASLAYESLAYIPVGLIGLAFCLLVARVVLTAYAQAEELAPVVAIPQPRASEAILPTSTTELAG